MVIKLIYSKIKLQKLTAMLKHIIVEQSVVLTLITMGGGIFSPPVEQTQIAPEGRNLKFSNFVTFNFILLRTFLPIFMSSLSIFSDL